MHDSGFFVWKCHLKFTGNYFLLIIFVCVCVCVCVYTHTHVCLFPFVRVCMWGGGLKLIYEFFLLFEVMCNCYFDI